MPKHKVIIVGAGIAGLTCAKQLVNSGFEVLILEKSDGLGGRVRTDLVEGFRLDRGFQVLLTAYPEAHKQLDYDRLELSPFIPGALVRREGKFHRLIDPWRRPWAGVRGLFGGIGSLADRLRIAKLRYHATRGTLRDLFDAPEITTMQALRNYGFTEEMIDGFFRPFLGGVFLEDELQTSSRMLHFVFRMFSLGDIALPRFGMQAIPDQLAADIPDRCFHCNTEVSAVSANAAILVDGTQVTADQVVLAVDCFARARVLQEPPPAQPPAAHCFYFSSQQSPVDEPILVLNGDRVGPINNLCVLTKVSYGYAPENAHLISVSVRPSDTDDCVTENEIRSQAGEWFGRMTDDWRLLRTYHISRALSNQNAGVECSEGQAVVSNELVICGDYLGNGSLQSAFESGAAASDLVKRRVR